MVLPVAGKMPSRQTGVGHPHRAMDGQHVGAHFSMGDACGAATLNHPFHMQPLGVRCYRAGNGPLSGSSKIATAGVQPAEPPRTLWENS